MKKYINKLLLIIPASLLLISWGSVGHKKINQNAVLSFNQQTAQLVSWGTTLANHASDADYRKDTDPTESPKHYIDIDSYQNFNVEHKIIQDWDSIVAAFGYAYVINEGILPWATITAVDTLRNCFQRSDFSKAVLIAADLGHYVADGHMPLHITKNYNGQLTGNTGIHSRYESTMINAYSNQIIYSGDTNLNVIQDINQYVFNYIYNNYKYVDSIIAADNFAKTAAGGSTSSSVYTLNLWNKTKDYTTILFKNASHTLAELIYTAWVKAGSPSFGTMGTNNIVKKEEVTEFNCFPNPVKNNVNITFTLSEDSKDVTLEIVNLTGKTIALIVHKDFEAGIHNFNFNLSDKKSGIYNAVLKSGKSKKILKILLIK